MTRTGRRPGNVDTRAAILTAARDEFAARGYRGATIRGIATQADVDPALVHHYFGTKRELFAETLRLPFDPARIVTVVLAGDPTEAGERIARTLLSLWSTEAVRATMASLLRSALTDDESLETYRTFMFDTVVLPLVSAIAPDHVPLRASLLASQIIGLTFVRYLAEVEPLASADAETVVSAIGPTLQRYLVGDLAGA
jgi:AcrR family transcriptional regulator